MRVATMKTREETDVVISAPFTVKKIAQRRKSLGLFLLCTYSLGYFHGRSSTAAGSFFQKSVAYKTCTEPRTRTENSPGYDMIGKSVWDVAPFEHTAAVEYWPGMETDAFNPFHNYVRLLGKYTGRESSPPGKLQVGSRAAALSADHVPIDFPQLPRFHTWNVYLEAYHNHLHRFRGKSKVVFMEVGVQSGGKIAAIRDYIGPGLEYIGIDVNPSTKMFEAEDEEWTHIEIGDSGNRTFWNGIIDKYPHVDIFLDDGGHTMQQQRLALEMMLPHVQPDGVFIVEDLSTSWHPRFSGLNGMDARSPLFLQHTAIGLIHQTLDWLNAGYISGGLMDWMYPINASEFFSESWWEIIPSQVKHIHYYNQLVVYEKGKTVIPRDLKTVGRQIPYGYSGEHPKVDWKNITNRLAKLTGSSA